MRCATCGGTSVRRRASPSWGFAVVLEELRDEELRDDEDLREAEFRERDPVSPLLMRPSPVLSMRPETQHTYKLQSDFI